MYDLEDFLKPNLVEDRVYRLRCVEAWSMVIPWRGVALRDVVRRVEPTSKARFVELTTLLDEEQMPCAEQVIGEIYIRSDYLTLGYLDRPEETESKFIQNPCHDDYPDPVYRSGDLAKWNSDRQVEFVGRKDLQITSAANFLTCTFKASWRQ